MKFCACLWQLGDFSRKHILQARYFLWIFFFEKCFIWKSWCRNRIKTLVKSTVCNTCALGISDYQRDRKNLVSFGDWREAPWGWKPTILALRQLKQQLQEVQPLWKNCHHLEMQILWPYLETLRCLVLLISRWGFLAVGLEPILYVHQVTGGLAALWGTLFKLVMVSSQLAAIQLFLLSFK